MTKLDAQDDKMQIEKLIHDMPRYATEDLATHDNKNGVLPDGQCFQIDDEEGWRVGVFVKGKMAYVFYENGLHDEKRLEVLKRNAIVRLTDIAETGWVPTATMPYMPQRYQHIESGKVLFTAEAVKNDISEARHDNEVIDEAFKQENISTNTGDHEDVASVPSNINEITEDLI